MQRRNMLLFVAIVEPHVIRVIIIPVDCPTCEFVEDPSAALVEKAKGLFRDFARPFSNVRDESVESVSLFVIVPDS